VVWGSSADFDLYSLGFRVAGGVGDGEGIGGGFLGRDVEATVVGRPDGIVLGLKSDGFGVGNAIAELERLAAMDGAGAGVKHLDGKFTTAELINDLAIGFLLLLRLLLLGAAFDLAIFHGARKEDPGDDEGGDAKSEGGIEEWIFEDGLFFGWRVGEHVFLEGWLLRKNSKNE
jgi:hypothetical protein